MQGLSDNPFWALLYCESKKKSNSRKRKTKSVTLNPSKANLHLTPHYSWNRKWGNKRAKNVTQDTRANVLLALVPPASLYIQKSTTVSNKFSEFLDPFTWTSPISPHGALSLSLSLSKCCSLPDTPPVNSDPLKQATRLWPVPPYWIGK